MPPLSQDDEDRLVELTLACPIMRGDLSNVIDKLPTLIRDSIRKYDHPKQNISSVIRVCNKYILGIHALIEIIRFDEVDSYELKELIGFFEEISYQGVPITQVHNLWRVLKSVNIPADKLTPLFLKHLPPNLQSQDIIPKALNYYNRRPLWSMTHALAQVLEGARILPVFVNELLPMLPAEMHEAVQQWLVSNPAQAIALSTQSSSQTTNSGHLSLLIALHPIYVGPKRQPGYYRIQAWVWGGANDRQLSITNQPVILANVGSFVRQWLNEIGDDIKAAPEDPTIEAFVVYELIDDVIEQQMLSPQRPLSVEYPFVLRLYDRLHERRLIARCHNRWKRFKQSSGTQPWIGYLPTSLLDLDKIMDNHFALGFASSIAPGSDWHNHTLEGMVTRGTPVALWPRECPAKVTNLRSEIEELMDGDLSQLPHRVYQMRKKAAWGENPLGKHLTLIFDDAARTPPNLTLQSPLESSIP